MEAVSVFDIARRFEQNPLLTPKNIEPSNSEMVVKYLLNPGVFRFDKKVWLLVRVAECPVQEEGYVSIARYQDDELEILHFDKNDPHLDFSDPRVIRYKGSDYLTSLSYLRLLCSEDGKDFQEAKNYHPIFGEGELENFGVEDCRVAEINGIYYLTYSMVSSCGVGIGLIQTRDWKRFDRKGMILPPHNKDCAIFEEKIRDRYYALHRPGSPERGETIYGSLNLPIVFTGGIISALQKRGKECGIARALERAALLFARLTGGLPFIMVLMSTIAIVLVRSYSISKILHV